MNKHIPTGMRQKRYCVVDASRVAEVHEHRRCPAFKGRRANADQYFSFLWIESAGWSRR
jgi:hypothetical protein